jgi:hypothetical protein
MGYWRIYWNGLMGMALRWRLGIGTLWIVVWIVDGCLRHGSKDTRDAMRWKLLLGMDMCCT